MKLQEEQTALFGEDLATWLQVEADAAT
jgi:membrane protein